MKFSRNLKNFIFSIFILNLVFSLQASINNKKYREIKNKNEYNKYIENTKGLLVVNYYADWCGACTQMSNIYAKIAEKYNGKINFSAVNIDNSELKSLIQQKKIEAVPTTIFIKNGKEISKERGALSQQELENNLKVLLANR